jgi:hypothetical protein
MAGAGGLNLTPMLELAARALGRARPDISTDLMNAATAFLTPDTPTTIDTDALIVTALAAIDETLADPHFE